MQNYLLTLSLLLLGLFTQAQTPEAFNYQAVVRDAGGQILSNQEVGLQVSLIADSSIVYVETHSATTNSFGLVNLAIGRGTVALGQFDTLDWSQAMFIQIGLDVSGGSNYLEMGTAELLSVPYALYATGGGTAELPNDPKPGDIFYYDGTAWQRLPAGEAGTVLTMGSDGLPVWQELANPLPSSGTITDPQGNSYTYAILLDGKKWMTQNLNYDVSNSWCYDDLTANCDEYGRLYTWEAAKTACEALGDGWRLPTDEEWKVMTEKYGGYDYSKEAYDNLIKGGASGFSGFSALLGGIRYWDGSFGSEGADGYYWSASGNVRFAWNYGFLGSTGELKRFNFNTADAYSVRCFQDQ